MSERNNAQLAAALRELGIIASPTNIEQVRVMAEALDIFAKRGELRGELWRQFDSKDKVWHIRNKAARIEAATASDQVAEDDAIDIVNYACFYVRQIREEASR